MRVRFLVAAAFALMLSACDAPLGTSGPAQSFPTTGEQKVNVPVSADMPQWLSVARQRGGGQIFWDRSSLVRYPGQEATIWAQVRYGTPEVYEAETETTRQIVRYEIARMHFRFKCGSGEFAITEQRFIGNDDVVLGSTLYDPVIFRPVLPNTAAAVLQPIACLARSEG
ncbi:MAG: hypothetical protein ACOYKM_01435 [Caulobacterales bacterium]|jgi:hypothetical protein